MLAVLEFIFQDFIHFLGMCILLYVALPWTGWRITRIKTNEKEE